MEVSGVGGYYSYLLRIWQAPAKNDSTWRIQLESIQTGKKCGFASLEDLLIYLRQESSTSGKKGEGNQSEAQG